MNILDKIKHDIKEFLFIETIDVSLSIRNYINDNYHLLENIADDIEYYLSSYDRKTEIAKRFSLLSEEVQLWLIMRFPEYSILKQYFDVTNYNLKEYPSDFSSYTLNGGLRLGSLYTPIDYLEIVSKSYNNKIIYGVMLNRNYEQPLAVMCFIETDESIMLHDLWIQEKYKNKAILSELFNFVLMMSKRITINDPEITENAKELLFFIINSEKYKNYIYHIPTKEIIDFNNDIVLENNEYVYLLKEKKGYALSNDTRKELHKFNKINGGSSVFMCKIGQFFKDGDL